MARSTGTIRVRALLDNADRQFTGPVRPRAAAWRRPVPGLLIDDKAVLTDQDRKYVYVVDKDGRPSADIQLGRTADGLRIVEHGLAAGDKVIIDGVQKVFMPGMPVQAKAVAMQPPAASPHRAAMPPLR